MRKLLLVGAMALMLAGYAHADPAHGVPRKYTCLSYRAAEEAGGQGKAHIESMIYNQILNMEGIEAAASFMPNIPMEDRGTAMLIFWHRMLPTACSGASKAVSVTAEPLAAVVAEAWVASLHTVTNSSSPPPTYTPYLRAWVAAVPQ
jgi:hypothetical protein